MHLKIRPNDSCYCGSGKKFKKCHGSEIGIRELTFDGFPWLSNVGNGSLLYAYTDETGNSGNHLFDPDQPEFWTGTVVSRKDLNLTAKEQLLKCLDLVKQDELHGNKLGLGRIELIADILTAIIRENGCIFLFTQIEKRHLAGTKFVDTVLDSGLNRAVTNAHYGVRGMRMPLALSLIQMLSEEGQEEFWRIYGVADAEAFAAMLTEAAEALPDFPYDERTKQLLGDALLWGAKNPQVLLEGTKTEADSPNLVAFSLLVDMLHWVYQRTGSRVKQFIHDEQNQFAKWLEMFYDLLKGWVFESHALSTPIDMTRIPTFACDLTVRSSRGDVGLQLCDVALWLVRRDAQHKGEIYGKSRALLDLIKSRSRISRFTLDGMIGEVNRLIAQLNALPITPKQMIAGSKLKAEIEERRIARMTSSE